MNRQELAARLREVRLSVGLTQAEVASELSVSRPTLVAIEHGNRRVSRDELGLLAGCFGMSMNQLLATDAVHLNLSSRFRSLDSSDTETHQAVVLLNRLASITLQLERLLNIQSSPTNLFEQPVHSGRVKQQAIAAATTVRQTIGVGMAPISDISTLLEVELGFHFFRRVLPSKISGLFGFDPAVGPCVLLNEAHPVERQNMTAAHELGHFVSHRSTGYILGDWVRGTSTEERFANEFSYEFLMPYAAVFRRFRHIVELFSRFTPRDLIAMARTFYVSCEAMCRRLEALRLLPKGTYDSLSERKFSPRCLGDGIESHEEQTTSQPPCRLERLAMVALDRGILSEGQVSEMLDIDRVRIRFLMDEVLSSGSDDLENL